MKRMIMLVAEFSEDCQYRLDEIPDARKTAPLPGGQDAIIEIKAINGAATLALLKMCCGTIPEIDVDHLMSASDNSIPSDTDLHAFQHAYQYHLGVIEACEHIDVDTSPLRHDENSRDVTELFRIVNCKQGIAGIVSFGRDVLNRKATETEEVVV